MKRFGRENVDDEICLFESRFSGKCDWVALAVGVVGAISASESADAQAQAAQGAADTSYAATKYATDIQQQQFEQQRADQEPWRLAGVNALGQMTQGTAPGGEMVRPFGMSDYQADPGYQFRLDEGMKALERSAAARGGLLSGATMKGIERFGQQSASDEYQNAYNRYQTNQGNQFNRLASLAGVGQTATNALGQAGQAYAGNVGNLAMQNASNVGNAQLASGQARASAYQGIGSSLGSAFGNPSVQNAFAGGYDSFTSGSGDPYMGSSNAYYL